MRRVQLAEYVSPMTPPLILGMSGRIRSGKTTFAEALVRRHGFVRMSFADALRAVLLDADPYVLVASDGRVWRLSELVSDQGWVRAKLNPEVRRLMEVLGQSVKDRIDGQAWVRLTMQAAARAANPVVIDDVRFNTEVNAILKSGGVVVHVDRDESNYDRIAEEIETRWHVSNDGSLDDLNREADRLNDALAFCTANINYRSWTDQLGDYVWSEE